MVYLALYAPDPVARDVLAADLWPHLPPTRQLSNLRLILHTLQRYLAAVDPDGTFLQATSRDLAWDASVRVTTDLRQVLLLADGPPPAVESLVVPDGTLPDWTDAWFEPWRHRFEEARIELLERRVMALESAGQPGAARQSALRLLSLRPTDESIHLHLMRLMAAEGDLAGARQQVERCRQLLADELGQPPSPTFLAMARQLLERPTPPPAAPPAPDIPPRSVAVGHRVAALPQIDRSGQVVEIVDLIRHHRLVVIAGPAGSGKTRLLQAVHGAIEAPTPWMDLDAWGPEDSLADRIDQVLGGPTALGVERQLLIDHAEVAAGQGLGMLLRDRLQADPRLRVLVGSRRPLGVGGERLWRMPPLFEATAGTKDPPTTDNNGATYLAAALGPSEPAVRGWREAFAALADTLQGRPSALLAAAIALRQSAKVVEAALDLAARPEALLDIPLSGVGSRHATLGAGLAADAAWLEPPALATLVALARFPGDFSLADACTVVAATDEGTLLDLLVHLSQGALLARHPSDNGDPRFRIDPLVRAFWSRHAA
jgi:DNA-binding SARP family transcriptional activator/energy-coupling factor transporter ATP-binding protein EcfA2